MQSLMKERDAAEQLGCSVSLLHKWRTTRTGPPYVKVGNLVRYDPEDLEQWIASHRVTTGGGA
jgi:predicted DNA-binding transcriptional regulator AlpA